MERYDKDPNISFLGYQSCIHGLYKISDCALVPTRFAGELFPLCIIQAMQVGTPIIASRIGEIEAMMTRSGSPPGILIDVARDTEQFIHSLQQAMSLMLDEHKRAVFSSIAASYGQHYDMTALAGKYFLMFKNLADDFPLQYSDSAKHTRSASLGNNVTIT
jgi:glycosyltransferase involved in cell wall biosynthesis